MSTLYCFGHNEQLPTVKFDIIREHDPQLCIECKDKKKKLQAAKDKKARQNSFADSVNSTKRTEVKPTVSAQDHINALNKHEDIENAHAIGISYAEYKEQLDFSKIKAENENAKI